jgi:DNA-3-methyladenine glycosylase II
VSPEAVLAADPSTLRETGLSGSTVESLRAAATAVRERDRREGLADASDEAVIAALTEIRGVGEWIEALYANGELSRAEMRAIAEP